MTVAAILRHKGCDVVTARPGETVAAIAGRLTARRIGAVMVCDGAGRLCGVVSERDIVHALVANGAGVLDLTADQIMSSTLRTVTSQGTVSEAMAIMTESRVRHLPVVDNGALVGVVSIGDVVMARIMQQDTDVDTMRAYVAGAG